MQAIQTVLFLKRLSLKGGGDRVVGGGGGGGGGGEWRCMKGAQ